MKTEQFNKDNFNQQLIIAGMTSLVTDEGYTTRQVFELLEEMKSQLWRSLSELEDEDGAE